MDSQKEHWENIYKTKKSDAVSWYKPHLDKSLELLLQLNLPKTSEIIDVGGGASTFPDDLLANGFRKITVLDISSEGLNVSKQRLGEKAQSIRWIEADILKANLNKDHYDFWHDRAVFHFLTAEEDKKKYAAILRHSLKNGGFALIATFGPHGPLKCSGLDIVRYSPENLHLKLGQDFKLQRHFTEIHKTPFDTAQEFLYCLFQKV